MNPVRRAQAKKSPIARFYALLAIVGVIGVGVIVYLATRPKTGVRAVDPNLPPAKAEGYLLGNPAAPVQIVEFADFECPACGNFATVTEPDVRKRLVETGQASFRFYDYPLPMHKNTWSASHAAACANEQGKFWEMHDRIFAGQFDWNGEATSNPVKVLKGYARELGLDVDKWQECVDSQRHQRQIEANRDEAIRRGVGSTPTFVIGGKMIPGALPYDDFKRYVEEAARNAPAAAPATTPAAAPAATPAPAGTATGAGH